MIEGQYLKVIRASKLRELLNNLGENCFLVSRDGKLEMINDCNEIYGEIDLGKEEVKFFHQEGGKH